jgi:N-acetylmuramoyl-L-alanine amidase
MKLVDENYWAVMTIWGEARGESYEGKVAVGEVIRNRVKRKYNGDGSIPGTVLRKFQFSCWNTEDPNRILMSKLDDSTDLVKECINAWKDSESTNLTKGAVLYCNLKVVSFIPSWAMPNKQCAVVGSHTFYND